MAVIVVYNPTDPQVSNKVTGFFPSAHAPDFDSEPFKVTNPDLAALWTAPQGPYLVPFKYWKFSGGNIVEMSQVEKNVIDQLEPEKLKLNEGVDADSGPTGPLDASIEVERGSAANASFKWDQGLGTWVIGTFGQEIEVADIDQVNAVVGLSSINDLSDVRDPQSPSDGQVLTWNNGNGEWEAADAVSVVNVAENGANRGNFNSLNFIGDVTAVDGGGGEADITIRDWTANQGATNINGFNIPVADTIVSTATEVRLAGDEPSPSANKYYGTNGSSVKGYHDLPSGGVTDHGALTGLGDDDHTQYHNDSRGDARYYTQAQVDAIIAAIPRPTFVIFAEENSNISVGTNNYEYSFGNGAVNTGFSDVPGIPLAFPCTLIALGISSRQNGTTTATASISVTRNGSVVATSGIGSGSGNNTKCQIVTQVTPDTVNFVAGDTVQFLTASVSGTHDDVRVFAWFERTS